MKRLNFSIFILLTLAFISCSNDEEMTDNIQRSDNINSRASTGLAYTYPITPDDQEWAELDTHDEMLAVTQIPDSILYNLSTEELLEVCLDYPLLIDALAYNTLDEGINALSSQFNGFKELLSRNDCNAILKQYIYNSFILSITANTSEGPQQFDAIKNTIIGRIIEQRGIDVSAINCIPNKNANTFNNINNTVDETELPEISTLNGNKWNNVYALRGAVTDAETYREIWAKTYPKAKIIAGATYSYNCHAYAWYMTEGNGEVWLDPNRSAYGTLYIPSIEDGSFKQTNAATSETRKIIYLSGKNVVHSAVYDPETGTATSKWSQYFLFSHPVLHCPYSSTVKYYAPTLKIDGPELIDKRTGPITETYTLQGTNTNATTNWTITPEPENKEILDYKSIRVTASRNFTIGATVTLKDGTKYHVDSKDVVLWGAFRILNVSLFQYGQSGFDYSLKAEYEGSEVISAVWSCDNPEVVFNDVRFPDDIAYNEPNCVYTEVTFPRPGDYTIIVYPIVGDVIGDRFEQNIHITN